MPLDIDELLIDSEETSNVIIHRSNTQLESMQADLELSTVLEAVEQDSARPGILTYDIETVPDESRFPAPAESKPAGLNIEKQAMELLLKGNIGEITPAIQQATNDELLEIRSMEGTATKPRKGVLDAIDGLMKSRITTFADWSKDYSTDPYTCKICSLAWAVGVEGEIRSLTANSEDQERQILRAFWNLCTDKRTRVGFGITRFDDPIIINRSLALGVEPGFRMDLRKYGNKQAADLEQIIFPSTKIQKCKVIAKAWRISIPCPEMDGGKVYALYQTGEMDKIGEYNRSDVYVEREMWKIASKLFA